MSPALVDPDGQTPSSFNSNSPHSINNPPFPRFPNQMDPNVVFNSPSIGSAKPAPGFSRPPRFAKLRKSITGHRPNLVRPVGLNPESQSDPAKPSPEQNAGRGAGFGPSKENRGLFGGNSGVVDELGKLRIGNDDKGFANRESLCGGWEANSRGVVVSELPEEMRRLYIESEHFGKVCGGGSGLGGELPNKMKKLDIRDDREGGVDGSAFGESSREKPDAIIREKMTNLRIDSENEKVGFGGGSGFVFGDSGNGNDREGGNLDMGGGGVGSSSGGVRTETSAQSSVGPIGEMQSESLRDGNLQDGLGGGFVFGSGFQSVSGSCGGSDNENAASSVSNGIRFNPVGSVPELSVDRGDKKVQFSFTSKLDSVAADSVEFKTPDLKGPVPLGLNRKVETRRSSAKVTGSQKKKGKWKKPVQVPPAFGSSFVFQEHMQENAESSEQYSPMDFSPYEEIVVDGRSRETSVASEESFHLDETSSLNEDVPNVSDDMADEGLVSATEHLHINECAVKGSERQDESSCSMNSGTGVENTEEDAISGVETESFKSATDELDYTSDSFVTAADAEVTSGVSVEGQDCGEDSRFGDETNSADICQTSFIFAASSANELFSSTRIQKKKNRIKFGHESYVSTPSGEVSHTASPFPSFQASVPPLSSAGQGQKLNIPKVLSHLRGSNSEQVKGVETKGASNITASIAAQESCEKWRLRGNQAYAQGDYLKAEDYYTQGVNCISGNEASRSCLRALMLCYSNRAATRMSLGRVREALEDCMKASAIDPNFLKVQVRAASCYLALGEVESATLQFMKCLEAGPDVCADRKLLIEASEGLEKAQKLAECMKQAAELLGKRTASDTESALSVIAEALTISSHSKSLLQMKADALLSLKKYEELIHFCEELLGSVESNFDNHSLEFHGSESKGAPPFRVWCCSLILKSYFNLGRLEEALSFLQKQEDSGYLTERTACKTLESLIPFVGTMRELLRHKAAGNEAYQSEKYAEAIEHYTAAVQCSVESRPFAAICFCNRSAAYRAMGQIVDALSDCSLAIALDGNYVKAISRRATLYEMIRDYGQAITDLQKLISLLTKETDRNELRQARMKLSELEEAAKKEIPLNMYLILGISSSAAASEIKKAYHKAALKYHPDKAGQSLARNENQDDGIWKEIAVGVRKDAERLFKMIGEAYAVLSDTSKRSRYDLEEERRNAPNNDSGASRMYSDFQQHPFERNGRRQWQEAWRSYQNSQRAAERNRHYWYS